MPGTIRGSIRHAVTRRAPGIWPRTSAYEAAVPSTVAKAAAGTMISTLTSSEFIQAGVEKSCSYQRSEKPGGGNCRNGAELNEITTTTTSGASNHTATTPHRIARRIRHGRMPSPLIARPP